MQLLYIIKNIHNLRFLVFCCVMGVCGKHNYHSTKVFSDSPALPIFLLQDFEHLHSLDE